MSGIHHAVVRGPVAVTLMMNRVAMTTVATLVVSFIVATTRMRIMRWHHRIMSRTTVGRVITTLYVAMLLQNHIACYNC